MGCLKAMRGLVTLDMLSDRHGPAAWSIERGTSNVSFGGQCSFSLSGDSGVALNHLQMVFDDLCIIQCIVIFFVHLCDLVYQENPPSMALRNLRPSPWDRACLLDFAGDDENSNVGLPKPLCDG